MKEDTQKYIDASARTKTPSQETKIRALSGETSRRLSLEDGFSQSRKC